MLKLSSFYKVSKYSILLQLIVIILGIAIVSIWGQAPTDVEEYFKMSFEQPWKTFVIDDAYNILLVFLYIPSFIGIYLAIKDNKSMLALFSTLSIMVAVLITLNTHTGLSMMTLAKGYYSSTDLLTKQSFVSAGRAIMASSMWYGSTGYFSGILLQGGSILLSLAMIGSKRFSIVTILAGSLANGLDLINHLSHYDFPALAENLIMIAGPLYIIWYISLFVDLIKITREEA